MNTLRVDGEIFESGKKKLRIQRYPNTCGRGLNILLFFIITLPAYVIYANVFYSTNKEELN